MGLVSDDDGWRMPDWLWERIEPLLPGRPPHPLGCHNPRVPERDAMDAILIEACRSWLNRNRAILIRWSKKDENHLALLQLSCGLIAFKKAHAAGLPA